MHVLESIKTGSCGLFLSSSSVCHGCCSLVPQLANEYYSPCIFSLVEVYNLSCNMLLHLKPGQSLLFVEDTEEGPNVGVMSTNIDLEPSVPTPHNIVGMGKVFMFSVPHGPECSREGCTLLPMSTTMSKVSALKVIHHRSKLFK